jgi:hypothetical protein
MDDKPCVTAAEVELNEVAAQNVPAERGVLRGGVEFCCGLDPAASTRSAAASPGGLGCVFDAVAYRNMKYTAPTMHMEDHTKSSFMGCCR